MRLKFVSYFLGFFVTLWSHSPQKQAHFNQIQHFQTKTKITNSLTLTTPNAIKRNPAIPTLTRS